ncbi:MAG: class I SAM-dependent methyltransferase [Pseudomonadota bacterium]
MTDTLDKTRAMLAKHHRNGEEFAQLMKDTFAGRFDEAFWREWGAWIEPALSARPVIMDLGTGPGVMLRTLKERYPVACIIGVEAAPYMLEAARAILPEGAGLLEADLHDPRLPLADKSVDAALAAVVLHEMNQPVRALQEVHRLLKPGGRFCVLDWVRAPLAQYLAAEGREDVFAPQCDTEQLEDVFIHFIEHNRFSSDDLRYLLEHTGFKVLSVTPLRNGQFARIFAEKL